MPDYIPDDQVFFSPPDTTKSKYIPDDQVDFNSITTPAKPRSALGEIGTGFRTGFMGDLPQQFGQAAEWATSPDGNAVSQSINRFGHDLSKNREEYLNRSENQLNTDQHNIVTNTLASGAKMLPSSIIPAAVAGAGVAGAIAAAPFEVPAAVGLGAAALAGAVPIGMSQAQQSYEAVKKAGIEAGKPQDQVEHEALVAGRKSGAIETLGEALGTWIGGKFIGFGGKALGLKSFAGKEIGGIVADATDKKIAKPFFKEFTKTALGETATEMGQNYGEAVVEKNAGVKTDPNQQAIESILPTIGMTVWLAPFGLAHGFKNAKHAQAINEVLSNPEAAPKSVRAGVVDSLHEEAVKQKVPDADQWLQGANQDIENGLPVRRDTQPEQLTETVQPEPSGPISKAIATQLPTIDQVQTTSFAPPDTSGIDAQTSAANEDQIMNDLMAGQETSDRQSNFRTLQRNTAQQNEQAVLDQQASEALRYNQLQNTRGQRGNWTGTADMPVAESPYAKPLSPQEQRARDTIASQYDNSYALEGAPPIKYTSDHDAALYGKDVLTSLRNKQKQEAQNAIDKRKSDYVKENPPAQTEPAQEVPRQVKRQAIKDANEIVNADPVYGHMDEVVKQGGFNLKGMKADFDKATIRQINRPGLFSRAGKINIDEYAGDNGYKDANEMVEAFKSAKSKTERRQELIPQLTKEWQDGDTAQLQAEKGVTPATDEDVQASIDVIKRHPEDAQDIINHPSFSPEQKQQLVAAHQSTLPIRTSTGQPFTSENQARRFANRHGVELGKTHDIAPAREGGLEIVPKPQPIEAQNANTQRADRGSPEVAGPVGNETGSTAGRIPAAVVGPEGKVLSGAVEAGTGKSIQPVAQEQPGMADNQPKADIASAGPVSSVPAESRQLGEKTGQEQSKNMSPDASVTETGTPGSTRTLSGDVSSDKSVTPKTETPVRYNPSTDKYDGGLGKDKNEAPREVKPVEKTIAWDTTNKKGEQLFSSKEEFDKSYEKESHKDINETEEEFISRKYCQG